MPKRMLSGAFAAALACTMCPLAATGAPEAAFAAEGNAKATSVDPINVTAPVAVIFGGSGYDVSNPQPSITTTTTFSNGGKQPVYVSKLECEDNNSAKILEKTGSTELTDQKMFSMYPSNNEDGKDRTVSFGVGSNTQLKAGDIGSKFFIDGGKALDCTFRLNLANSSEVENASMKVKAAEGEEEITGESSLRPLAKVKYTFASYPASTSKTEADLDFFLLDRLTGKRFDLDSVKSNADSLSKSGDKSPYYELYMSFVRDTSSVLNSDDRLATGTYGKRNELYTCALKLGDDEKANRYMRIVGINSHYLAADGNGTASDKKSGLTFEAAESFAAKIGKQNFCVPSATKGMDDGNLGDWSTSLLRARMIPNAKATGENGEATETSQNYYGKNYSTNEGGETVYPNADLDDDRIVDLIPQSVYDAISEVAITTSGYKAGDPKQPSSSRTTDKLFILDSREIKTSAKYQGYLERRDLYEPGYIFSGKHKGETCLAGADCTMWSGFSTSSGSVYVWDRYNVKLDQMTRFRGNREAVHDASGGGYHFVDDWGEQPANTQMFVGVAFDLGSSL